MSGKDDSQMARFRGVKPVTGTSTANTALSITKAAVPGKKLYCIGYEVLITGAAAGAVVTINLKQGSTIVWPSSIPSGAAIGTTKSFFPSEPVEFDAGTAINLDVSAGGTNCVTKASMLVAVEV